MSNTTKSEPIDERENTGQIYRRTRRWDESLPLLGVIAASPSGEWIYDDDFTRATRFAQDEDYGGVDVAYAIPLCGGMVGAAYDRQRVASTILKVVDACDMLVCAWGRLRIGSELVQFVATERQHARLHHLGFKNGFPLRFSETTGRLLTRWRV